jgi:hypothetical protein
MNGRMLISYLYNRTCLFPLTAKISKNQRLGLLDSIFDFALLCYDPCNIPQSQIAMFQNVISAFIGACANCLLHRRKNSKAFFTRFNSCKITTV